MSKFSHFPHQVKTCAFPLHFALERDPKNIFCIVGPVIRGGGKTFQKLSHLGVGVWNFLQERGDKTEKGEGCWCRNGGVITFLTLFVIHRNINEQFFLIAQARCFLVLKSFPYPLYLMWVQSGIFICPIIVLNLNIKFNFCARLGFNVFWFVKCMKIRKLEIEIISI